LRVFDGFLVNDELDLLELRLMELDPIVDTFVAIQMDRNFRGQPKDCHLDINESRWSRWAEKIKVMTVTGKDFGPHPDAEWTQRRLLSHGFESAEKGDLLMLSDVDEIPSRRVIDTVKDDVPECPITLVQRLYYYSVDLRMCRPWAGTVVWPHGCVRGDVDLQHMRSQRHFFPQIQDAGWHFSWMGDSEAVQRKLRNLDVPSDAKIFGGGIDNIPHDDDSKAISDRVARGVDLFLRQDAASTLIEVAIEPGQGHPHEISEWLKSHPEYVRTKA